MVGIKPWVVPDWPAPAQVRACTTTRSGGTSLPPWDSLNLADHVGDNPDAVADNRARVMARLGLPSTPRWLHQVHSNTVLDADTHSPAIGAPTADACVATRFGPVCAVLTADCVPVLFCDRSASRVAAAHAGWRGLAGGVLEATVEALQCPASELMVWLGPAIGPNAYQVGAEVREEFIAADAAAKPGFAPCGTGTWLADLYFLARRRLARAGVTAVFGGQFCTFLDRERFFSYRRDGETGRMASLVWLEPRRSA